MARPSNEDSQQHTHAANGSAPSLPSEITLLTLNCWGLLHISALRTPRLAEIGRQIAALHPTPHIVCLQECWVQDDYNAIRDATAAVLPHAKFYHSGAFGGGLAILSRWPIEQSCMFPYKLNGRPTAFWRGDWYVGKGVATASVRYGPGKKDVVEVFNTHVSPARPLSSTHQPHLRLTVVPRLMLLMKADPMIPICAIGPLRHGKLPNSSVAQPTAATWSSHSATST
jgi:hypothetical protein